MGPALKASFAHFVVLGIALVAVSHGAIFARLADATPLAIAAWRLGLACIVVLPLAATAARGTSLAARPILLAAAAGLLLALHFATWIASLDYTSIARSVLLVSTAPIWVAIIEWLMGRGAPARGTILALGVATAGAVVVSSSGLAGGMALTGDLLAVAGAIAMAGYLLLSRESQQSLPFRPYLGIAYGSAAAGLWLAVAATQTPVTGFDATTWWALAGMAVVSQLIGHSGYNWSLRQLRPLFVAIVLIGEPVLAALFGWWLLGEGLDWRTGAGGLLILSGIVIAATATRDPR